jgi:F0F1-type ATP synthase assembly protein I
MSQLLSKIRIEKEVLPKYPNNQEEIRKLSRNVRISIRLASVILVGIIVLGMVIMRNS